MKGINSGAYHGIGVRTADLRVIRLIRLNKGTRVRTISSAYHLNDASIFRSL